MKNDFTNFSAKLYLKEYYSVLGNENKALLEFLHQTYSKLHRMNSLLELGGGPAIYQLISARNKVSEIIFSEFVKDNRDEVIRFLKNDKDSFDWSAYVKYVLGLEKKPTDKANVESVCNQIRSKIIRVIPCNIYDKNPLAPLQFPRFDILSMGSVAETISSNETEFKCGMKNSINLLRKGGYFIGYFSKNCRKWTNGKITYRNFPIDEDFIKRFFKELRLKILDQTSSLGKDFDQDYHGIFCVFAKKS